MRIKLKYISIFERSGSRLEERDGQTGLHVAVLQVFATTDISDSKPDFCKQIFVVRSLAGHHDSAITLPNRFPVQNVSPGTIQYICCKKIQFCCKFPPHHGPRTLLSSKSPNYQFILPSLPFPSPAAQDRSLRPSSPSPDQTRQPPLYSQRVCLSRSFKRLLFTESFFSSWLPP